MNLGPSKIISTLVAAGVLCLSAATAAQSTLPPAELVKRTVNNELSSDNLKFMFRDQKNTSHGSQTKLMVQTNEAMAALLIAVDGKPLGPNQRQQEQARLEKMAHDPDALDHKKKQEKEDAEHVARIMRALPDAFIYEEAGTDTGKQGIGKEGDELIRLKFRPNPKYDPPSHTEQVLTGMQGFMLIDARKLRLAKIDGTLFKDVGFGWGILGHLNKGGRFVVGQGEVGPNHWEITQMNLDFTGKIMMFKTLNIKSDEVFSGFRPVPSNLTFAQGVELLKKQEDTMAKSTPQDGRSN